MLVLCYQLVSCVFGQNSNVKNEEWKKKKCSLEPMIRKMSIIIFGSVVEISALICYGKKRWKNRLIWQPNKQTKNELIMKTECLCQMLPSAIRIVDEFVFHSRNDNNKSTTETNRPVRIGSIFIVETDVTAIHYYYSPVHIDTIQFWSTFIERQRDVRRFTNPQY